MGPATKSLGRIPFNKRLGLVKPLKFSTTLKPTDGFVEKMGIELVEILYYNRMLFPSYLKRELQDIKEWKRATKFTPKEWASTCLQKKYHERENNWRDMEQIFRTHYQYLIENQRRQY